MPDSLVPPKPPEGRQIPHGAVETPAYVFDEKTLVTDVTAARDASAQAGANLLFAMKSCAFPMALKRLADFTAGLHASSLFEARLAREVLGPQGLIHLTTPAIVPAEIDELAALSDMISLNSLSQWDRFKPSGSTRAAFGLRVNPEISLIQDERFDPCRRHSKLGAPLSDLREVRKNEPRRLDGLTGLLIHSNSESTDFDDLRLTVEQLDRYIGPLLEQLQWINLGGGYMFRPGTNYAPFDQAVDLLRSKYGLKVFLEPGTSIIRDSGRLVATVVDLFASGGATVAVLDASVNHMPESFEFQFEPAVAGDKEGQPHKYILAGATCLAGDIFGEYAFAEPLELGAQVIVEEAGAYSMVKAHMFNGVNLPSVYWHAADGSFTLSRRYEFEDFKARCGV
ncbi:type III PLP-dependent enzyme domain-containing protein [Marimonas lutisalis]|uniref:hypothetical protein n=1 Tax=Marimonas lutisalis TaxID=2545756 RepID=UPI0010F4B7C4|nr:hypothetical protein [Marimonas lutisalis]